MVDDVNRNRERTVCKEDLLDCAIISDELRRWLESRDNALKFRQQLREEGGHVMLRSSVLDPDELDEPLRSEALGYLAGLKNVRPL